MVGRTGFEPVKAMPVDLQSTPFGHSGTYPFYLKKRIPKPRRARRAEKGFAFIFAKKKVRKGELEKTASQFSAGAIRRIAAITMAGASCAKSFSGASTMVTFGLRGPQMARSVGPNKAITGVPVAAARWVIPLS